MLFLITYLVLYLLVYSAFNAEIYEKYLEKGSLSTGRHFFAYIWKSFLKKYKNAKAKNQVFDILITLAFIVITFPLLIIGLVLYKSIKDRKLTKLVILLFKHRYRLNPYYGDILL